LHFFCYLAVFLNLNFPAKCAFDNSVDEHKNISKNFRDKNFLKIWNRKTIIAGRNICLTKKSQEISTYRMQKFDGHSLFPQNVKDGSRTTKNLDAATFIYFCVVSKCFIVKSCLG